MDQNILNWFEIPVVDFDRGLRFYSTIYNCEMPVHDMGNDKLGFFPYEVGSGKLSGAIICGKDYKPSKDGVVIYLNCNPDLSEVLGRVEAAGGEVLVPKTQIAPDIGYFAQIIDTEGNRVALHSQG